MTTITITIDDNLAHALCMAKSAYLHHCVLPVTGEHWRFRMNNYDLLTALYHRLAWAVDWQDAPLDASIA